MKQTRFSEEQIIQILGEADQGITVEALKEGHRMSERRACKLVGLRRSVARSRKLEMLEE